MVKRCKLFFCAQFALKCIILAEGYKLVSNGARKDDKDQIYPGQIKTSLQESQVTFCLTSVFKLGPGCPRDQGVRFLPPPAAVVRHGRGAGATYIWC